MKVVVAVDSFKGSMSSMEAGRTIRLAMHKVDEELDVEVFPLADGGEGTMDILTRQLGGKIVKTFVTGPLGAPVPCEYGIVENQKLAIIEIAKIVGLTLVPEETRKPYYTTTYGIGEVIRQAMEAGCREFMIGLGGSATNDGGIGMLQALGFGMLDADSKQVRFGAGGLEDLYMITARSAMAKLKECTFHVACDVKNPLCGKQGCSMVFAPQKGATDEEAKQMDIWMKRYGELAKEVVEHADMDFEGAGAAGGLGFAFATFLNGKPELGSKVILDMLQLEDSIKEADLIITGEGCLDGQTVMGKGPIEVARLGKKYNKKVIAIAGSIGEGAHLCHEHGIDAYFPILQTTMDLGEAMKPETARSNLMATVIQVMRILSD
ncbi:MAG: glycerate kinase [Lachnospiraceae bacterium]